VDPKNKVVPIRQPSLFEMEQEDKTLELASILSGLVHLDRPYDEPGLLLGTSAFTANGWAGSFYPAGMSSRNYLTYYATQFATVEVDSTFYGTPSAETVSKWYSKTPPDFVFATKVPQIVTHEKMLMDCETEFEEFVDRMQILNIKLGPLLFQFPKFNKFVMNEDEFLSRLRFFLARVKDSPVRFVVEIRNKAWLTERLLDVLRENRVALALSDTSFMPRPWEQRLDLITTDFVYVRLLGDRKGIERETLTWDKTIVDRTEDLHHWVDLFGMVRKRTQDLKIYAYANNHYQGHGPGTVKLLWDLYKG
jgi:uncharacterized protein YecE (DUF72 family)